MVYIRKIRWINSRVYSLILKPSRSCFFGTWRYATFYRKILRKECKRISQKNMSRFPNTQIISRCKFWQDLKFLQPINIDHKRCPTWYAEHFCPLYFFCYDICQEKQILLDSKFLSRYFSCTQFLTNTWHHDSCKNIQLRFITICRKIIEWK